MEYSAFLKPLDNDQRKILLAFIVTIPISYVFLTWYYPSFLLADNLTRGLFAIALAVVITLLNYISIVAGTLNSNLKMGYRFAPFISPQAFALIGKPAWYICGFKQGDLYFCISMFVVGLVANFLIYGFLPFILIGSKVKQVNKQQTTIKYPQKHQKRNKRYHKHKELKNHSTHTPSR